MPSRHASEAKLKRLDSLLRPESVAVVGASESPGKIGYTILKNVLADGYSGKVFPINPHSKEILGLKAYRSVLDVPEDIDAAVLAVPAGLCAQVAEECGRKGVKSLIVIASGFGEIGRRDLEEELAGIARRHGMRLLGPNVVGILSNSDKLNASFAPFLPFPGRPSLVSQSGCLLVAIDAATYHRRVGFDRLVSIGNMSDVDFADCIEWLDADPGTTCIALYIEGLKHGRRFIDAARRVSTPVVALKAGVSPHGAAAAASHTGSLAGAAAIYRAAFEQCGVVQASDLDALFDRTLALSLQPPMKGDNLLVLTNGGGIGVMAADAAEQFGLPLRFAPDDLQAELRKHMPEYGSARNPADLSGMAGPVEYRGSVRAALAHPWVDAVAVLYCDNSISVPTAVAGAVERGFRESGVTDKPLTAAFVGGEQSDAAIRFLTERGLPAYDVPDKAVNAAIALRELARIRSMVTEILPVPAEATSNQAREIIAAARAGGRTSLTELEAKEVFGVYGLPTVETVLARSPEAAVRAAREIGYPVVVKIVSPEIIHKSDAGGVRMGLRDEEGVREAFETVTAAARAHKPEAEVRGVAVQRMARAGTEVILGSVDDPSFGPTVMFGLGGIFVEVLRDVTFRVAPVSSTQAGRMIDGIAAAPLLTGARGAAPLDRDALVQAIMSYSRMILDLADEIAESDANPVLVYERGKGALVVDARIILKPR